jgi:hypothetical protein
MASRTTTVLIAAGFSALAFGLTALLQGNIVAHSVGALVDLGGKPVGIVQDRFPWLIALATVLLSVLAFLAAASLQRRVNAIWFPGAASLFFVAFVLTGSFFPVDAIALFSSEKGWSLTDLFYFGSTSLGSFFVAGGFFAEWLRSLRVKKRIGSHGPSIRT